VARILFAAVEQAQGHVVGVDDMAGGAHEGVDHRARAAFADQAQAHFLERGQARGNAVHVGDAVAEQVAQLAGQGCAAAVARDQRGDRIGRRAAGHQAAGDAQATGQVVRGLRVELRRQAGRQSQFGIDGVDDGLRLGGLGEHGAHAAAARHRHGLVHRVDGRVENDAGGGDCRFGAQLLDKFVAVHGRHQDVGDDQVGALGAHDREGGRAVAGFEQAVAEEAEQVQQEFAIAGAVVDDQYGGHQYARGRGARVNCGMVARLN
jgi:hypothetical protein